jgi:oligopeptide transport system substrate-binding protein
MKRAATLFLALAASLTLLGGCGSGSDKGGGGFSQRTQGGSENVFRYPIVTNPTSMDPHVVQDGDTIDVLQNVYEGLVGWDTENRVVPILAESWEISEDGTTYTFKIKQGVKFHNGRELTAEDIKYGFERATTAALKSPTADTYLTDIIGVKEKLAGTATEVAGVKVIDPLTLTITIDKPRPYFLGKLTYPVYFPVPKEVVEIDKEISQISEMVGTGPFKVAEYVPDQLVALEKFVEYHGGEPQVDRIERPVVKDPATRLNKYKSGELDLVMLERQDVLALQDDPQFKDQLQFFPRPSMWYLGINVKEYPPFAKRDVRRAFAMAVDKEQIVKEVLSGINTVANSVVPPGVLGYREDAKDIKYNPEEAKRLLAAAGYPNGQGMPELTMYFREQRPDIRIVAEAAAAQIKENLGVEVKLRTLEWRNYLDRHNKKELPFYHMRWAADYLDAENFLSVLLATYGGENKTNYSNPEYDALTSRADSILDEPERLRLYAQAEDIVLQDAIFIPIYFQRDAELISPKVKGLRESLFGHLPHTTTRIE